MKFWVVQKLIKIEAAGRSEGRDRDRLKGNGETESFKRTELAANRQPPKFWVVQKLVKIEAGAAAAPPPPPQGEVRDGIGTV